MEWKDTYEYLDRQLAVAYKTVCPPPGHRKAGTKKDITINLTDAQLMQIAAELGIDLEEDTE